MANLLVIGHRGIPSAAPENTIPSFRLAAEIGVFMLELDVQLSKDGELMVIHDSTLDRTTTGSGKVQNFTLAELKKLDAGEWFGPEYSGTTIPTLQEVFDALPQKVALNIEVKAGQNANTGIARKLLGVIHANNAIGKVIVSSFDWQILAEIHRMEPKIKLGMLFSSVSPLLWSKARLLNAYSLHPNSSITSEFLIWQAHAWGYKVYPFVVNDSAMVLKLAQAGIDGFFTDYPQFLLNL
ncbi:MAG TPA: glycerophosphodiester phosphodiesterase family protein [Verrucomicrobiae bacterium]|nr:glycerophosphodiester phosphodiesterase family protein [Verrucomicrobiae bacterium]